MKYQCSVCGYIYDPAEWDGVELKDNPDFRCPACGAGPDSFQPVE